MSAAAAARSPTLTERIAVTRALPVYVRALPAGCVWLDVRVAANGRYAYAGPVFLVQAGKKDDPCVRYAGNGYFLLRKAAAWKVVYEGSELPPCSLGVPRDLVSCRR